MRPTSSQSYDTGGGGFDACGAKTRYEASKATAEAADEDYKKLDEPEWDKLSHKVGPQIHPAELLRDLRAKLAEARQSAASAGNPTPQQAEKNYQAARDSFDATEAKYVAKITQASTLARGIQALMSDIQNIDAKLKNATTAERPSQEQEQKQKRAVKIKEYDQIIADAETKIEGLVVFDKTKEKFDMDVARDRVADPKFKDFSTPEITTAKYNLDQANPETGKRGETAYEARERQLETAIEKARTEAKKTVREYSAAFIARADLEGQNDGNDNDADAKNEELRKQKVAKQKQLQDKIAQKARLGLQKPMEEDVLAAVEKIKTADANRTLAKKKHDAAAQQEQDAANDLRMAEPWLVARLVRNGTEKRMKDAQSDYMRAINLKDSKLGKARQDFGALQTWINDQKNSLRGRVHDATYWQQMTGLKNRGRSSYTSMELDLQDLACFPDVKNLLDDIRARRRNIEAIVIGKPVKPSDPIKPSQSTGAVWVCDGPVFGKSQRFQPSAGSTTFTYQRDGQTGRGTVTYSGIPSTVREGQIIRLTMSATAKAPAGATGWFNFNCAGVGKGQRGTEKNWDNNAASWPDGDRGSPSPSANMVFKFSGSSGDPYIQAVIGMNEGYTTEVLWKYRRK